METELDKKNYFVVKYATRIILSVFIIILLVLYIIKIEDKPLLFVLLNIILKIQL